jgi:hypothetical protein
MIYKKRRSEVQGLWCRKDKVFYYYESGHHSVRNPLDRIKTTLISRNLLTWSVGGTRLHEEPIVKMSWAEAEERGYVVQPMYFNNHVKEQAEAEQQPQGSSKSPWS